jgi:hypothetical protein
LILKGIYGLLGSEFVGSIPVTPPIYRKQKMAVSYNTCISALPSPYYCLPGIPGK